MEVLLGKSSVNGPFSIGMLNYQRVSVHIRPIPWPPGHPLAKNCVEISGLLGLWNWHFNRPGRRAFSKEGLGVTGTGLAAYRCMICMCWLLLSDSFRCFRAVRFAENLRQDATSGSFGLPRGSKSHEERWMPGRVITVYDLYVSLRWSCDAIWSV